MSAEVWRAVFIKRVRNRQQVAFVWRDSEIIKPQLLLHIQHCGHDFVPTLVIPDNLHRVHHVVVKVVIVPEIFRVAHAYQHITIRVQVEGCQHVSMLHRESVNVVRVNYGESALHYAAVSPRCGAQHPADAVEQALFAPVSFFWNHLVALDGLAQHKLRLREGSAGKAEQQD